MYDRGQLHAQDVRFDLNKNDKSYKESVPFLYIFCQHRSFYNFSN